MRFLKWLKSPALRIGVVGLAAVLWLVGLADQLESAELTARYLMLSAAIVAVTSL